MKLIKTLILSLIMVLSLPVLATSNYSSSINIISQSGLQKDEEKKLIENLDKRLEEVESFFTVASTKEEVDRIVQKSEIQITEGLKPYGFFKATISSKILWNSKKKHWAATYKIQTGPRMKIQFSEIRILGPGQNDPEFKSFIKDFPLSKKDYLDTETYKNEKQKLMDLAAARGYFKARLTKSAIEIDLKEYTASVILHLETYNRFRFGCVTFERTEFVKKPLSTPFLQSFIPFKKGDFYEQKELRNLQQNLSGSQYFQQVIVQPDFQNIRNNIVPITVKLTPRKAKRYNFGAGYGTDTGPRGLAGIELRRLTSTGHYFTGEIRGSYKEKEPSGLINLSYNIPGKNPAKDLFKFSLEAEQEHDEDYGLSRSAKVSANYISEIKRWQQTLGITWQWERSEPEDEVPFTTSLIIPSAQWQRVISDDPLRPRNGYKLNLSLRGSSEILFSDTSFFQAHLYAKYLYSFNDNLLFLARAELGAILIDDLEDLPLSLRFFAGGSNSVRGYGYRNIKDGRNLAIGSVELQHRLYKHFFASAFFDAGNVSSNLLFGDYDKSVGVGLVYKSVLGSISLTVAQALDKPGQPRRVEFSMGPDL